jgi:hypothetical protein
MCLKQCHVIEVVIVKVRTYVKAFHQPNVGFVQGVIQD